MSFSISLSDLPENEPAIELTPGTSTFIVGANGSGKTRLAAFAEDQLGIDAHRISAHRELTLNPEVAKIREENARAGLRTGGSDQTSLNLHRRQSSRWGYRRETHLLRDFDFLIQTLFAQQSNVQNRIYEQAHCGTVSNPEFTSLHKLKIIWERILPRRTLNISGDDIQVIPDSQPPFGAGDMSDGERAVFYLLGQVLVADPNTVLIFDEPELHIHRAILAKLWDEIEAARPDCAFLVITHDLEFAATRPGQKFTIREFRHPSTWHLEPVPQNTGFGEEITTLILGSRRPILFVEGTGNSMDLPLYRTCYPDWTVVPRGSCQEVINAVATMRANPGLSWVTCAGIVDADSRTADEVASLAQNGVQVLPVSEIENLFLLPEVATAILEMENYQQTAIATKLAMLCEKLVAEISKPGVIDRIVKLHCLRRIDQSLKRIDLTAAANAAQMQASLSARVGAINIEDLDNRLRATIADAISGKDIPALMACVDLKGALLNIAASTLKAQTLDAFRTWLCRTIPSNRSANRLRDALVSQLPTVTPG